MERKYLIGTHDSTTGEKGSGFLSWLVTPFAKTQSKTIREQYEAGCRYFDIRVKLHMGRFYCAHGLWRSKRFAFDILEELHDLGGAFVELTYEGSGKHNGGFIRFAKLVDMSLNKVFITSTAIKYGEESKINKVVYENITIDGLKKKQCPPCKQCFLPLDGRSWHIYLPIPWLWKKFYFKRVEFNDKEFKIVDFL